MSDRYLICCLLFLCVWNTSTLWATQLPEGFAEVEIAAGLDPVAMALAPDGRVFLAEKNGRILLVRDGELMPDPFLLMEVDNYNERGVQSIALDPDFEINNYVYFFYMAPGDNFNRVTRWKANGDFAIPGSEEVLYEMDISYGPNHNGGGMQFGADGKLYIATGDGVVGDVSQSKGHTGGKMLRINSDGSIPADNPYYDEAEGKYKAIWSLGLRNPFTLSVQPNTGRMFFCDVGQSKWEEINEVEKGRNYGWPKVEGKYVSGFMPQQYKDPIHAYDHDVGCAVVGGTFYNPTTTQFPPEYTGQYFFMDYCEGFIQVMNPDDGTIIEIFATELDRPIALLVDHEGSMYYLARAGMGGGSPQDNTSSDNGRLMKIIYTGSNFPFITRQPASALVPENESVTFSVTAFGEGPLNYVWKKDGNTITGLNDPIFTIDQVSLADDGSSITCEVSNDLGIIASEPAILSVTSGSRPVPTITTPLVGATYEAGNIINFSGTGFDAEDGVIPVQSFQWRVDFHHLDHTHPAMSPLTGLAGGSFEIPQIGEISDEVFYRLYLTVTDSEGLKQSTYRDINPIKSTIELSTQPFGLRLVSDGKVENTPLSFLSVKGIQRSVVAPFTQERNDSIFIFSHWQDGSTDLLYTFFATDGEPIIAYYDGQPLDGGKGLYAEYFDYVDEAPNFDQTPKRTRIDQQINFNWVLHTPFEWDVGKDSFCIRWTGAIMPLFDETYTFYLNADDGVRLWIDDELVIDNWVQLNFAEESSGTFEMRKGYFHKIRLEYFEQKNNAMVILSWSSENTPKQVIPKGQLFPKLYNNVESLLTVLYPNPTDGLMTLQILSKEAIEANYSIFDTAGRMLRRWPLPITRRVSEIPIDVSELAPGLYFLQLYGKGLNEVIPFKKE